MEIFSVFLMKLILLIVSNSVQTQAETPLSITCPSHRIISVQVGVASTIVSWAEPQVTGGQGSSTATPFISSGSSFNVGDTTVFYRVVDEAGTEDTCTFTVTVNAPTIYGCPDQTVAEDNEPGLDYADVSWTEPRIEDESTSSSLTSDHASGDRFQIGQTNVTYTLTDDGPNAVTCQFIVEVRDVETPTFNSCPDDISTRVLAESACNVPATWTTPAASDNDGVPAVAYSHLPDSSLFGCGVTQVNFTATDPSGNVGVCKFNVTVEVGAYENCPSDVTNETLPGASSGVAKWKPPIVLDRDPDWQETASRQPGESFPLGPTNVTYTLVDMNGVTDVCSFTVTIIDAKAPVIRCPDDIVVTATSKEGWAVVSSWPQPSTSDNVLVQHIWSNHAPGDEFPLGETLVIYWVNDTAGLTSHCNFKITVRDFVLSLFTEIDGYTFVSNDDSVVEASNVVECLNACVNETVFVCRSAEYYTSTGECRLSENIARVDDDLVPQDGVTYFEKLGDNTPPTIWVCPNDATRRADIGSRSTSISWLRPLVRDDSGGPVSLTSSHQSGDQFYLGITQVVYTAVDEFLNRATCSFLVIIIDEEMPVIQDCPGLTYGYLHSLNVNQSVEVSWVEPTAMDNSGVVTLTATRQPGAIFDRGNTVVTYTAVDPSGNEETCSFTVSVVYIVEQNRFPMRIILPNLLYSDSLADKKSEHYLMLDDSLQMKVQEVFGMDPTFLDSTIIYIIMTDGGGVEIEFSLGFSENTPQDFKRREIGILYNLLKTDGLVGADVEYLQLIDDEGYVFTVDACYLLPCPFAMNCTVLDETCVSYCPDNPTYCRNGGFCVKPNGNERVSCLCSTFEYYGTRCELQDLINEPRTLATVIGAIWGFILLLLLALCFPVCVRRYRQSKQEHHGSDLELVKQKDKYMYFHSGDSDDDDEYDDNVTIAPKDTKKIIPSDPLQNGERTNPAFIDDEQDVIIQNGKTTLHSEDESNGVFLNANSGNRSQGDGRENMSDDATEAIDMVMMSDSNDSNGKLEIEMMSTSSLDLIGEETDGGKASADDEASADDSQVASEESYSYGDVRDDGLVDPSRSSHYSSDPFSDSTDSQGSQSVTAVVHNSNDGNFMVRFPLGGSENIKEEVSNLSLDNTQTRRAKKRKASNSDSINSTTIIF